MSSKAGEPTRKLILDVAERICALHGFESLSVRAVSEQARVNVAAISYHFGSKQQLFEEMFRRRVMPLNAQRLQLLDEALASPREVLLDAVIRSFIAPVIRGLSHERAADDGGNSSQVVMQFLARAYSVPGEEGFLVSHYEPVRSRFVLALQNCLPGVPLEELLWKYNIMVGALIYAMGGPERMTRLPLVFGARKSTLDDSPEANIARMAAFLKAGFEASVPTPKA